MMSVISGHETFKVMLVNVMHSSVEKTDQPYSTTETKPTRITEKAEEKTTTVSEEGEKNESDKTIEIWKIGGSVGGFLLLFIVIGKHCI